MLKESFENPPIPK